MDTATTTIFAPTPPPPMSYGEDSEDGEVSLTKRGPEEHGVQCFQVQLLLVPPVEDLQLGRDKQRFVSRYSEKTE